MKLLSKILTFGLLFSLACGSEREEHVDTRFYLIVPLRNCETCVDEIISFADQNLDNPAIKFIFTSVERKLFKLKLSKQTRSSSNVLLDETGDLIKDGIVLEGFLLVQKDNGRIVEQKMLNAGNLTSELAVLADKLMSKKI